MRKFDIKDMIRGWFIGNFEPTVLKTESFEVGLLSHKKQEQWPEHVHKIATEYNVLLKGSMAVNGTEIKEGEIFIIEPGESSRPEFFEDCKVLCIKVPSVIGDKYETIC